MSIRLYGKNWPKGTNQISVELWCYRYDWPVEKGGLGKERHMANCIKILWPETLPNGNPGYIWHEWTDIRIHSWCNGSIDNWQTWWGPSSSGKSTDAGILLLVDWLSAPHSTTSTVGSTTKQMLEKRIFGEILRYYKMHGDRLPGFHSKSKNAILLGDEDSKNGIFGIAIQKGSDAEVLGNLIGVHNEYNRLILDELQSLRQVAVDAADNLSTGRDFKFLGMGNPQSRLDTLGRYSKPVDGWGSISPVDTSWKTEAGECYYFDGLKSPAIKNPKKYFFLLNQTQIDAVKKTK